ncbi:MAG: hypothetical protein HOI66_05735 [Verrucomicrobia bacterium]|jgi:hypothetical protein|nr:hypothetical protein [Verrucomicrobiota bacterium]MDB4796821.1 hypothetical protein [bacterium]
MSERVVQRVQTGFRMEKRILKVLKAIAEYHDITLGDLLEGIVLHAFEAKTAFSPETLSVIKDLKRVYGLDLDTSASHKLIEQNENKKEDLDA